MIMDAYLLLSDAQAFTATAVSTNTIDLGGTNRDIGAGAVPMTAVLSVDVAADFTTGDEAYTFELITSAAANLGSPTVIASRVITAAQLAAGTLHYLDVPMGVITQRYLGARLTLAGTTPTVTATIAIIPRSFAERMQYYPGVF